VGATTSVLEDAYELSPTQQGMLFHALEAAAPGVDLEQVSIELDETLDPELFLGAWRRVVDRHAILRTRFRWDTLGAPVQEVLKAVDLPVARIDAGSLPQDERASRWEELLRADRSRPFALDEAPLLRLTLVRWGETRWTVLWSFHHALLDGRSFPLVLREVFGFYDAAREGRAIEPGLPRPYRDYIAWLRGVDLAEAEAYWRRALARFAAPTPLPVARALPEEGGAEPAGGAHEIVLGTGATERLKAFAAAHGLTLHTLVQGAWAILLHRYSGEEDIVFGATRACRRSVFPDAGDMIGLFINTLPMRTGVEDDTGVLAFLKDVRARQVAVRAVEHTPLAKVQAWSAVPRGRPLFDTLVVYDNDTLDGYMRSAGADPSRRRFAYRGQTNYPITVIAYGGATMVLRIENDRRRIDDAAAARMLGHLRTLLEAIPEAAGLTIGALPLVAAEERAALAEGGASRVFAPERCLHERFEEHAAAHPEAVAVTCEGAALTYAELNRRANRLAHRLRAAGVGPEQLVGLCVERNIDLVVGVLGILKAGGAYLPIDLSYPADRVAFMLEDAAAPIVVTERGLTDRLQGAGRTLMCLDDPMVGFPDTNPASGVDPSNLMYVIYTSGSTGRPKGALITHHNVDRLMRATDAWYRFGRSDVWTLFHSIAFDFTVWELWGALAYGGRLVVVPYWVSRSPESFLDLVRDEGVTVLNQTPSAFRQLVQADLAREARPTALRTVIFGGEALELQSLRPWFDRYGDTVPLLVNMYGITETCVHVTYRPIRLADVLEGRGSVIGEPIPDVRVVVLDPNGEPVPLGVPGEMYVGGAGLARGYLNRPELTAQRFVPDPFHRGERLYRTGDLARRLPGGDLEYLGRIDLQVKIRGFRIELGEIESVIAQHPAVRECVVISREDTPGDKRLVAYLAATGDRAQVVDGVRALLKTKVPDYMIPAAFVFLEALPLTPNGKVDRKALPAPDASRVEGTRRYVEPANEAEIALASIWSAVLGAGRVGRHDNFFELGGDSILAIQVIARARQAGFPISPRELFRHPTIAELAASVAGAEAPRPAAAAGDDGDAPLTPIESWFFDQDLPERNHYNQAFVFEVGGDLDAGLLERAFAEVVARHDALRFRYERSERGWRRRIEAGAPAVVLERHDLDLTAESGRRALEALASNLHSGLDLGTGPLLRAALVRSGAGRPARLVIVVHHVAIDGVSWRILLEDLESAYAALGAGRPPSLAPSATSYGGWARAQAAWAPTDAARAVLPAWLARGGEPARLPLRPGGAAGIHRESDARTIDVALDAATTRALIQDVPQVYRTRIEDLFVTALALAFEEVTGARRLLVDLEGHGREDIVDGLDLTRTVGWFTSIYPVDVELPPGNASGEAIKTVKERLRAVPDRGVGWGILSRLGDAATRERLAALPRAEILFNYLGQQDAVVLGSKLFRFAREGSGPWHAGSGRRSHPVEVLAKVADGVLGLKWTFTPDVHAEATIRALANAFVRALAGLVAHCLAPGAGGLTPSDLPAATLSQAEIDGLPFPPAAIEDAYPLTPMQRLFLAMDAGGGSAGFEAWRFRLEGPLDVEALRAAWADVVRRHAILRSAFVAQGVAEPHQVVLREVPLPWRVEDWRGLEAASVADRSAALEAEEIARGFDPATAPLLRVVLARTGEAAWDMSWSTHHLLVDGWSWPVVFHDLAAFYAARREGRDVALPPAPRFREYVRWLRTPRPEDEPYWRRTLDGIVEPTPIELGGTPEPAEGILERSVAMDAATTQALSALARESRTTLGVVVQAAWAVVLAHHADTDDVLFGAAVSGRPPELAGIDALVGPCVNNVPIRVRVPRGQAQGAWLARLQRDNAERTPHQYASPESVSASSGVPPSARLFDSIVVFQNYRGAEAAGRLDRDVTIAPVGVPEATAYLVTLAVTPGPTLSLRLLFPRARLAPDDAEVLLSATAEALRAQADGAAVQVDAIAARLPASTRGRASRAAEAKRRSRSAPGLPPATAMEAKIAAVWRELFRREDVGVDRNFFDLGGHSVLLVQAHAKLCEVLGRDLAIVDLLRHPTVRALAHYLSGAGDERKTAGAAQDRARLQRQATAKRRPGPRRT
jgi:amino acid adenylation domain-containing protein/non-ribosomal peptide synthase protein (TIGR01720 family)